MQDIRKLGGTAIPRVTASDNRPQDGLIGVPRSCHAVGTSCYCKPVALIRRGELEDSSSFSLPLTHAQALRSTLVPRPDTLSSSTNIRHRLIKSMYHHRRCSYPDFVA